MTPLQASVRKILENSSAFSGWTLQGFGMLRLYLTDDRSTRLHVWSPDDKVPNVSEIHTHPWDFESTVVSGTVRNIRYYDLQHSQRWEMAPFMRQMIKCGEGGGLCAAPTPFPLRAGLMETYRAGKDTGDWTYKQKALEIHQSLPEPGAVTIIQRAFGTDVDHAYVFWPEGEEWVSAEPRPATALEITRITGDALRRWAP